MEAYKIGVTIALANGVSPVLAIIGRDMLGLGTKIKDIENNFAGWSKALLGVGGILAGATILGAMGKLVDKTREFQDELIKLQRLGGEIGNAAASGTMTAKAFDISKRVPMKVQDLLKIPGATYSIMGEHEAMETWEPLAKYAWTQQADAHFQGDVTGALQKVIRAGEMSGRITDPVTKNIDPQRLAAFLDTVARIKAATHGTVNEDTLLALAQQGGPTLRGLSDQGFLSLAIQSQMMGGHRAGTAYMSLWQQLAGGTMMKRTAQGMEEMGFLKPGEWTTEGGHVSISKEASNRLTNLIGQDPLAFAQKINEELAKRGITDPIEQQQAIMRMTGRQTTQRLTMEEATGMQQMIAERARMQQGLGAGASYDLINDKSVTANLEAMKNAWNNLLVAVAGPNSENVVAVLKQLTGAINGMTAAVSGISPETMKAIFGVVAAIGAGLVALGAISLASLASVPALIGAAVIALGAFVAVNWESIKNHYETIRNVATTIISAVPGLGAVAAALHELSKVQWQTIVAAFDGIKNAIMSFIEWLESIPGRLRGWFGNPNGAGRSDGDSVGKGLNQPMRFVPGTNRNIHIQNATNLNIDGRTLAQAISDQLEQLYGFPTGAPSPDGSGRYFAGDHNFSDT
ncbi:hypothetical protein AAFX91_00240 [Bradyrhizobium sp. 31Argb]|uniref:hypothetical protein n=1 Tax=Bradyrhizobium sp. 31Argb TaxID=3141247 RepID=UPI0037497C3D